MKGKKVSLLVDGNHLTGTVMNESETEQCIVMKDVTRFVRRDEPEEPVNGTIAVPWNSVVGKIHIHE